MFGLAQEDWIIGDPKQLKFDVLVHKAEMSGQCCLLSHRNTRRQSTLPAMLSLVEIIEKFALCTSAQECQKEIKIMVLTLAFWHAHESSEKCKQRTWVLPMVTMSTHRMLVARHFSFAINFTCTVLTMSTNYKAAIWLGITASAFLMSEF